MIKAAYIMPHPPLIIPAVGRGQQEVIQMTADALEQAAREISEIKPEVIIFISPHSLSYADYIQIAGGASAEGSFEAYNAGSVSMKASYDTALVKDISDQAASNGVPAGTLGMREDSRALDHGVMVPMYFINKLYTGYKTVRISISGLPRRLHYKLGICIKNAVAAQNKSCVIIASGDLSHKLKADGPYGFDKSGPDFDSRVTAAMRDANFLELLELDGDLCDAAAECGLRSFVIMSGALDGKNLDTDFLSYEGPFGVGYAVCAFRPTTDNPERCFLEIYERSLERRMSILRNNENEYVSLARLSLETYIKAGIKMEQPEGLSADLTSKRAGVFVSIKKDGQLRGCIGTISATQNCIAWEIITNAISAGVKDSRFDPVMANELDELVYSVDILGAAEKITDKSQLDVKRFGVIVTSGLRRGLLLPNLEGVDTVDRQVAIALQKAGIKPTDNYSLERFEVVRYT